MKNTIFAICISLLSLSAYADQWVNGYTKSNGTQVQGYYRSDANSTKADNWSTKGNTNPYTGKEGTRTYGNDSYKKSGNSNYGYGSTYNSK